MCRNEAILLAIKETDKLLNDDGLSYDIANELLIQRSKLIIALCENKE